MIDELTCVQSLHHPRQAAHIIWEVFFGTEWGREDNDPSSNVASIYPHDFSDFLSAT